MKVQQKYREYGQNVSVNGRVELSPGYDLWARGARFGTVVSIANDVAMVRMDHPQVKNLQKIPVVDLKGI